MRTEVAFLGDAAIGMDVDRVVRAGLHARLASDAVITLEIDDAIFPGIERVDGADADARCVIAVVTSHDAEVASRFRILTLFDVLDPGAKAADRHLVLCLTGHRAGMTSDTLPLVEHEAVTHGRNSISQFAKFQFSCLLPSAFAVIASSTPISSRSTRWCRRRSTGG